MPVPSVMADLSVTAASNYPASTDTLSTADDGIRALAAIVRTTNAQGTNIASATTTDIGAATGEYVHVTGTTTITGLGTIAAGIRRVVEFDGALTLTHNATSLILPGAANITTAAGDVGIFISLGSGNWKCVSYTGSNAQFNSIIAKGSISATGAIGTSSTITTAAPAGGAGAWKLGKYLTGAVTADTAHYVQVVIDGSTYALIVAA